MGWESNNADTRRKKRKGQGDRTLMVYEFINPCDPYTFEAPDQEVAALVVGAMGTAYGAEMKDDENQNIPVFILGGYDAWYKDKFGRTVEEGLEARKQDLAAALSSFLYGRPDDRKLYNLAMKGISNPETRKQYAEEWHNRRTSMSDLGKKAWMLGEKILGETK